MKKLFSALFLATAIISLSAQAQIAVTVNNEILTTDTAPTLENETVMVPLRAVFEKLGMTVNWDGETSTVFAVSDEKIIMLQIGNPRAFVNSEAMELETPAMILNDRTLVPASFIENALGVKAVWHASAETLEITSPVEEPASDEEIAEEVTTEEEITEEAIDAEVTDEEVAEEEAVEAEATDAEEAAE